MRRGWLSGKALVAVTFWGLSFVATRVALEGGFAPLGLVTLRLVLGIALLLGLQRIGPRSRRGRGFLPVRADRARCALLGLILAAHLGLQTWGLRYTSAIHTGWIVAFMPVGIAVGAQLFLRQGLRPSGWGGVALGVLGVGVVIGADPGQFLQARLGDALQLWTVPTWAAYTLLGARPVARSGALRVTTGSMFVAVLVLLPAALASGFLAPAGPGMAPGPTPVAFLAALFLGFVCSGLALSLWFTAQRERGSQEVAATLYFEPLVTVVAAGSLLGEPLGRAELAGGATVLLGVWLVVRAARARTNRAPGPTAATGSLTSGER